jgi:hypothetical protein
MFSLVTHHHNLLQKMENNNMNTTESRREFEEWARPRKYTMLRQQGDYESNYTQNAWEAWQAANGGELTAARAELNAVTEQRDQWKDKYLQQNKDLGYELRDPNGTIWSECKRLQTELTAARAEIEQLREANRIISGREGEWIAKAHYEIDCLREQRDRLAKAVNAATILIAAKGRHNTMLAYEGLRDALQSLTTNEL